MRILRIRMTGDWESVWRGKWSVKRCVVFMLCRWLVLTKKKLRHSLLSLAYCQLLHRFLISSYSSDINSRNLCRKPVPVPVDMYKFLVFVSYFLMQVFFCNFLAAMQPYFIQQIIGLMDLLTTNPNPSLLAQYSNSQLVWQSYSPFVQCIVKCHLKKLACMWPHCLPCLLWHTT